MATTLVGKALAMFGGRAAPQPNLASRPYTQYDETTRSMRLAPGFGGDNVYDAYNYGLRSIDDIAVIPPFYSCVQLLAGTGAGLPMVACRNGRPSEPMERSYVQALLDRPNESIPRARFWRRVMFERYARGLAVVKITRYRGVPVMLEHAQLAQSRENEPLYKQGRIMLRMPGRFDKVSEPVSLRDCLIFTDESWDPFTGQADNPLTCKLRNNVLLYCELMRLYVTWLRQGGHFSTFVTAPDSPKEFERIVNLWKDQTAGVDKAGLPTLIGAGSDVKAVPFSAEQQQISLMLYRMDRITCSLMHVDPQFIYVDMPGSNAAKKVDLMQAHTLWLDHGYRADLEDFAGELTLKLCDPASEEQVAFNTDMLTQGTIRERAVVAKMLVADSPIATPNEGRSRIMRWPELEGEVYDEIWPTKGASAKEPKALAEPEPTAPANQ